MEKGIIYGLVAAVLLFGLFLIVYDDPSITSAIVADQEDEEEDDDDDKDDDEEDEEDEEDAEDAEDADADDKDDDEEQSCIANNKKAGPYANVGECQSGAANCCSKNGDCMQDTDGKFYSLCFS